MAKEEIAFYKFPVLAGTLKRAGVQLGQTYINDKFASEFTIILGETMEEEIKSEIKHGEFISVLVDGSTDCSTVEKEMIFVRYVGNRGHVCTKLLRLRQAKIADADGLKNLLLDSLVDVGFHDYKDRLIGFMSDGASVNFGKRGGLLAKLRIDMPWIIGIHCANHGLELAVKDACKGTPFDDICTLLSYIHSVYERSPKRLVALKDLGAASGEEVRKPGRTNGTRWIQHKVKAAEILLNQYELTIRSLSSITGDATVKGYVKQLISLKTIIFLHLFVDLLTPIAHLSLYLQGDSVNLLIAQSALEATLATLSAMQVGNYSESLKKLLITAQDCIDSDTDSLEFQAVSIKSLAVGLKSFEANNQLIVDKLSHSISLRFSDVLVDANSESSSSLLSSLKVLNVAIWPKPVETDMTDLIAFGVDEIQLVLNHFAVVLQRKGIEASQVLAEWLQLKLYISRNLQHLKDEILWSTMTTSGHAFTNVMKVLNILRIFPVSNAIIERCFSTMSVVKTDWRNRLGDKVVEHLVRIKKEGPSVGSPEAEALVKSATERFLTKPRRPTYQRERSTAAAASTTIDDSRLEPEESEEME